MEGKLLIGTSGWHYKHWIGPFYPKTIRAKEMFSVYAQHFDTVEINNTFYRLPESQTFDAWRENAPSHFQFAVKASRFITHMKKLKDPETSTAKFFLAADHLQTKLGPILFQLPPRWKLDLPRLTAFLAALPSGLRYVMEFRDESWLAPEVYTLLREHNIGLCLHDLGQMQTPLEITADFTYVRFHGPGDAKYSGSYSRQDLLRWAERIDRWRRELLTVYVYFNNDIGAAAVKNASMLKELLRGLFEKSHGVNE